MILCGQVDTEPIEWLQEQLPRGDREELLRGDEPNARRLAAIVPPHRDPLVVEMHVPDHTARNRLLLLWPRLSDGLPDPGGLTLDRLLDRGHLAPEAVVQCSPNFSDG